MYHAKISEWSKDQQEMDRIQAESHKKLFQIDVMQHFLVNLTQEDLVDA